MVNSKKQIIIQELRHQLYYSNPGPERDEVRRQLEYWLHHRDKY